METESSAAIQPPPPPTMQGAGGKLRRQTLRKFPATPYARPPHPQPQRGGSWLSRLVDPAYRLLSSGATRVLPSLLYKSSEDFISAENELRGSPSERDELEANGVENAGNNAPTCTSNFGVPESAKDNGVSRSGDILRNGSLLGGHVEVGMSNTAAVDGDGLSEIEKLMKGKTFSSDQIKRLTEVMKSRVVDQESSDFILTQDGGIARMPTSSHQGPRELLDRTQQNVGKVLQGSSTPLSHSTVGEKILASPVDIAKAYMARQNSEVSARSAICQDEKRSYQCDDLASNSLLPSPSPRPPTCWPGAIVHDLQNCVTPQSQKGRFGLPRTPYSRTIYSGSKPRLSRVQGDYSAINHLSSSFKQPQTTVYEQPKSSSVSKGSIGPIRRARHRAAAGNSPSGAVHVQSFLNGAFKGGNDDSLGAFSSPKEKFELGGTSGSSNFQSNDAISRRSDNRIPTAHPHSSLIAKTILEHLDRTPPTPNAKSGELKMASWQDMGLSNVNTALPKERNSRPYFEEFQFSKETDEQQKQISRQLSVETSSFLPSISLEGNMQVKDQVDGTSSDMQIKADASVPIYNHKAGSLDHFEKSQDSQITNKIQMHSCQSLGNKPVLPSISVSNRDQKVLFSADGSTGFTFPVSAPNGVSFEPPTPSLSNWMQQQKEEQSIPSFEFGARRSSPALVFSFPSTSRVDGHVRDSDITFKFGSDRSSRLSFSSSRDSSRDTMCY